MELIKNSKDKRARKLAKKRVRKPTITQPNPILLRNISVAGKAVPLRMIESQQQEKILCVPALPFSGVTAVTDQDPKGDFFPILDDQLSFP